MACIIWNSDNDLSPEDLIKKLFGSEEVKHEGKILKRFIEKRMALVQFKITTYILVYVVQY